MIFPVVLVKMQPVPAHQRQAQGQPSTQGALLVRHGALPSASPRGTMIVAIGGEDGADGVYPR